MRALRMMLIVAVAAAPMALMGSKPANAACFRECLRINASGNCSKYGACKELPMSAPSPLTPVRRTGDCPTKYQGLSCGDDNTCELVCNRPGTTKSR